MLTRLFVQNIVLIDKANLDFSSGLNVVTGETGAGKSTLRAALSLALGERADAGLIRAECEKAEIVAGFAPGKNAALKTLLAEQEIDHDETEELTLRRALFRNKPARAYVNDTPVTAGTLAKIGALLTETCGQFEDKTLLSPQGFRDILDGLLPDPSVRRDVTAAYHTLKAAENALEAEKNAIESALRERDYVRHVLEELNALAPETGEETKLAEKRARMTALEKNATLLRETYNALSGDYQSDGGLEDRLLNALKVLTATEKDFPEDMPPITAALGEALEALGNGAALLGKLNASLNFNPEELANAEERLFELRAAARKYRIPADSLPDLRKEFAAKAERADRGEEKLIAAENEIREAREIYDRKAALLSAARRDIAPEAAAAVTRELKALKMEKARFEISLQPEAAPASYGADRVMFEIAVNPGAPLAPLHKAASGGELSRFILALKCALSGQEIGKTLIFDEIDRGVGGATADAVGKKLKETADKVGQVLVITHSPQVAAQGETHFHIEKQTESDRARTHIRTLTGTCRQEEIARMLAGADITEAARIAAQTLLSA